MVVFRFFVLILFALFLRAEEESVHDETVWTVVAVIDLNVFQFIPRSSSYDAPFPLSVGCI